MLVDDEHYEIEKILDKRVRNGVTECLIRWKGYTEEYDTWEPEQTYVTLHVSLMSTLLNENVASCNL